MKFYRMTILVTRPEPAASELVSRLRTLGKLAWTLPLIEFTPGRDLKNFPRQLTALHPGDLVFVISQQVIKFVHPILQHNAIEWPDSINYYAIGRCTALAIHTISNLKVHYPDVRETSQEVLRLNHLQRINGKQALILRGSPGLELLEKTLIMRGAKVHYCECYQRCKKYYDGVIEGRLWRDRGIRTLIVTSGEMLKQLFALFSPIDRREWLLKCQLMVISERLVTEATKLGWKNISLANGANNDALLHALNSN